MGQPEPVQNLVGRSQLLLTPEAAATALRIGRTTVYALMKGGDLRPVHIGRSCRLYPAELERYVHCLGSASETAPTPTGQCEAARSSRQRSVTRRG